MPDHQSVRRTREATVGDERDLVAEPFADKRRGDVQHLAHAGAAGRPFVADDDHVARGDRARLDRSEALLLGVEHARGPAVKQALVPRELHDTAVGREVAAQHREPACLLERRLDRDDDLLARRLDDRVRDLRQRAAVDVRRVTVHEAGLQQLAGDERDTARGVQVGGDEASTRLDVCDDGRALGDAVELVDRELDAELVRDCEQVQHAVRRAACRRDRGRGVL